MIINGDLKIRNGANLISLGKLKIVKGSVSLWQCVNLESLGNLEEVDGDLSLRDCYKLQSLGNLKKVTFGNIIFLKDSGITVEYVRKEKPELFESCAW